MQLCFNSHGPGALKWRAAQPESPAPSKWTCVSACCISFPRWSHSIICRKVSFIGVVDFWFLVCTCNCSLPKSMLCFVIGLMNLPYSLEGVFIWWIRFTECCLFHLFFFSLCKRGFCWNAKQPLFLVIKISFTFQVFSVLKNRCCA